MQIILLLASILVLFVSAKSAAIEVPANVISLNDLSQSDREYLEYLENEAIREKRSGDLLNSVKSKISEGIKSKLSGIASASSHASGFITGGSKTLHDYATHDEKSFNFWDLQKSIFHTLFQAAKAIKGGLLAIKGQLIKGSGYVISAKGKLISSKGEAITNIGKHIASSAILVPRPHGHGHGHEHGHYTAPSGPSEPVYAEPPSSYGGPSGPNVEYHTHHHDHIPSAIGDHKFPPTYEAYKDHLPRATNQGILIVKKIPKIKQKGIKGNNGAQPPETHKPITDFEETINPPFTYLPEANPPYGPDKDVLSEYEQIPSYDSQPPSYEAPLSRPPSSTGYVQNPSPQHVYTPPLALSNSGFTKLEAYEPFSGTGNNPYNIQKYPTGINNLENFPSYPIDLHKRFDTEAQYSKLMADALLSPPSLYLQQHVKSKLNSRLKRLPHNKNLKPIAIRLKPKDLRH